jgi:hypothetical protein
MNFTILNGPDDDKVRLSRLLSQHLDDLRKSGLSDQTIEAAGLYSETDPDRVNELLGNYMSAKTARSLGPCLAFPFFAPDGTPLSFLNGDGKAHPFVRLKPSKPRKGRDDGKPIKYESPLKSGNHLYIPPGVGAALADPTKELLIVEGEKKALAAAQHGFPCVALTGVWSWQVARPKGDDGRGTGPRELIPDLAAVAWPGRRVVIAFDSDILDKPAVQWAEWHLAERLREAGADVRVIRFPAGPDGDKVGLDDYLVTHGADALRALIECATPPTRPATDDDRPTIVIGTDEFRVNLEAVAALAGDPNLYQRGGVLVHVIRSDAKLDPTAAVRRPPGLPVVRDIPPPILRERLTRYARWVKFTGGEDEEYKPAHPPAWSVNAVHARGAWPGIRQQEAVVNHPVLLPDGSILTANGYDRRSQLLVAIPSDLRIAIPDRPTRGDVTAAVATIDDVLSDFPFELPVHRAAWLAGLLTPLAWFAFEGPAPLLLIDGNVRGVGKGLLADVIALVLTGRRFPVMSYTSDKEELRKKITALAIEGERLVLLDNLAGAVGNDVLDMALTAERWKDRVLGVNRVYDGPLNVCWYATGNNVQLHADTARRCSHCRLETPEERPELRSDLKYPDLRRHVGERRGTLLSAALTILRGWFAAGKPRHGLTPWGSFEGWSGVVREAVVFAGRPDPGQTRLALQTMADRDALAMSALIDALARMDPDRRGVTTAEIVEVLRKPTDPVRGWWADLRSAVEELCGKLDGRVLGYRFRHFARRNFGGRMLDRVSAPHGCIRWAVVPATASRPKPSPPSPPSQPLAEPPGGDGGDGGDVPDDADVCAATVTDL